MVLDLILSVLLLYLLLLGTYRGFIELFIKSIGIGAGFFVALYYEKPFANFLSNYFKTSQLILSLFSFFLILVTFFGLSFFVYRNLKRYIYEKKKFSIADRTLGAAGGFLVFLIILSTIYYFSINNNFIGQLTADSKILELMRR